MDEIKTAPKVSVVVPAYNCEGFLPETLDCLLTQSLKDIQIIIVDDGSTDGESGAICDRYAAAHPERRHSRHGRPLRRAG